MEHKDTKTYLERPPSPEEIKEQMKLNSSCCAFLWKEDKSDKVALLTDGCLNQADKLVNAQNN